MKYKDLGWKKRRMMDGIQGYRMEYRRMIDEIQGCNKCLTPLVI